ncbi:MAG: 2-C-methyl-D-erythritol 4-phosphate cytidylyltransferase [Collinsella sp.]
MGTFLANASLSGLRTRRCDQSRLGARAPVRLRAISRSERHALDGVVCGQPAVDTLKVIDAGRLLCGDAAASSDSGQSRPRRSFWIESLRSTRSEWADRTGFVGTDDSSLVEGMGGRVCGFEAPRDNLKVTLPEDPGAGRGRPARPASWVTMAMRQFWQTVPPMWPLPQRLSAALGDVILEVFRTRISIPSSRASDFQEQKRSSRLLENAVYPGFLKTIRKASRRCPRRCASDQSSPRCGAKRAPQGICLARALL